MNKRNLVATCSLACVLALAGSEFVQAQQPRPAVASSRAQAALDQAAADGKYTFLMFYKQNDDAAKTMAAALKQGLADRGDYAAIAYAQVGDPAEQALVAKFDVGRAPMPMTLAIAPNGAMTGVYPQRLPADAIDGAFVTPTMMSAMKSLQQGRLVLVTVQGSAKAPAPVAVTSFQTDPHFKDRLVTLSMSAADSAEAKFVGNLQIDPKSKVTQTVLLAPPGVMVGKFDAATSMDEIAAALAKAGKCCEDPNCKHHQPATAPRAAPKPQPAQGPRR